MTDKTHVLLLTHAYWPEESVPARRWRALINGLVRQGMRVSVVAPASSRKHRAWTSTTGDYGERVFWIPGAQTAHSRKGRLANNLISAASMLPRSLFVQDVDVVIGTVPALTTAFSAYATAVMKRRPLVLEMRDAWPDLAEDAGLARTPARAVMEKVLGHVQREAAAVVTVTEGFAQRLLERGAKHVLSIPNGLPEPVTPLDPHPGVLRSSKLEVVYMGNHGESQGLETLIRAAALVPETVRLTLVGGGTQKPHLQSLADVLKAPVVFADPVSSSEVFEYYDRCDSCVVSLRPDWPSFAWTIPSKTFELLAIGRKLTAVLRGEAAELVGENQPESVVPADPQEIADYWTNLYENPQLLTVEIDPRMQEGFGFGTKARRLGELLRLVSHGIKSSDNGTLTLTGAKD